MARFGSRWANLRDNSSPSASLATSFYTGSLSTLEKLARLPTSFVFSSKNVYRELLKDLSSPLSSPVFGLPFFGLLWMWVSTAPSCEIHVLRIFESDLSWLITLKAVKVRESLCNWGYIASEKCASSLHRETIDFFFNCSRVKLVCAFFVPLLSALLTPLPLLFRIVFVFSFFISRLVSLGIVRLLFILLRPFCMPFGSFVIRQLSIMVRSLIVLLSGTFFKMLVIELSWIIIVSLLRVFHHFGCIQSFVW